MKRHNPKRVATYSVCPLWCCRPKTTGPKKIPRKSKYSECSCVNPLRRCEDESLDLEENITMPVISDGLRVSPATALLLMDLEENDTMPVISDGLRVSPATAHSEDERLDLEENDTMPVISDGLRVSPATAHSEDERLDLEENDTMPVISDGLRVSPATAHSEDERLDLEENDTMPVISDGLRVSPATADIPPPPRSNRTRTTLLPPSTIEDTFVSKSSSTEDSTEESNALHQKQTGRLRKQGHIKFLSDPLVGACGADTDGHSDDPPDDCDDSKKRRRQWQGQKERNKRKPKWIIDTSAWKTCISSNNTHTIVDLLIEKKIPDNNLLNEAYKVFEINFIRLICDEICKYIVQKSSHIIYVYPATMINEATHESDACTITFVAVLGEEVDLGNDFNFHIKNTNDPSAQENVKIKILEKEEKEYVFENETDSNIVRLTKCIQKHSTSLRKNHTNVCRISLSGFKSIRFGKVGGSMKKIDCITLYVCAKGLIPLGETLLPTTLDIDGCQVLVDVREGFVQAYTGKHGPYDTLKNLRMGCSIGCKNGEAVNGTLGGFFEMGGADFCMSSAHVFLSANEMKLLEMQETPLLESNDCVKHVYQPHDNYLMPFGRGRTAVYKEGGNGAAGVDVVSILIENRNPSTGEFPKCDRGQESDKEYSRGKVYNREEIRNVLKNDGYRCFYKYGCGTGWTTGMFRSECATFCAPHPVQDGNTDFQICLHNQFELYSDTDNDFAGKSDSGALVFMEDNEELVAVGMVVAGMAGEVCFVTPLDEIFKALKLYPENGLKDFTTGENESDEVSVNAEINKLKSDLSNVKTDVKDLKCSMIDMRTDIKDVKDKLTGEMGDIKSILQNIHLVIQQNSDKNS